MSEIKKTGMSRPPVKPTVDKYAEKPDRYVEKPVKYPYTNLDDLFGEVENKPDPILDKSITVRQATLIALEQCKSIFEPGGVLWNQAINAVVNALDQYAKSDNTQS